jgi:hypothetical protein
MPRPVTLLLAQLVGWFWPHTGPATVCAHGIVAITDPTLKRTQGDTQLGAGGR